ncbi:tyrosinase family oxidase copper chaperone [Streptomyces sp. O3]
MTTDRRERSATPEAPEAPAAPATYVTRRSALLVALGVVPAAVAVTVTAVHRSSRSSGTGTGPEARVLAGPEDEGFDEVYQGRRIRGAPSTGRTAATPGSWQVTVDGRPLHLMRRADDTYMSAVDHYAAYPTPLAATRAAVDELRGQPLRLHTS